MLTWGYVDLGTFSSAKWSYPRLTFKLAMVYSMQKSQGFMHFGGFGTFFGTLLEVEKKSVPEWRPGVLEKKWG